MGSSRVDEKEEDLFSDAREDVASVSDSYSEVADEFADLDIWTNNPQSVANRRQNFFQSMGFSFKKRDFDLQLLLDPSSNPLPETTAFEEDDEEENMSRDDDDDSTSSESPHSDRTSVSSLSETFSFRGGPCLNRAKHIDDQILLSRDYSSNSSGLSECGGSGNYGDILSSPVSEESPKKAAKGWLKKLGVLTHILDKKDDGGDSVGSSSTRRRMTRVHSFKKQFKELSSLCVGQEFEAHNGSIVVMKFSHDGKYLASAGEDRVVRVWEITEGERTESSFVEAAADSDSHCVYFGMNENSQVEPLKTTESEKTDKGRRLLLGKKSESACAVLPSRVFTISETPQHEFHGHLDQVLDLSWSDKGFLLSSSLDNTVRLWRVGSSDDDDKCIRVFSHTSYVTCVAFNPVDDNYYISGSLDGKVRIWDVSCSRVVAYTEIKEIVTAVSYRPDAKSAVVGTMAGECRFYQTNDNNQLLLDREMSLYGKRRKVLPGHRITGFQFFTGDSDRVMVTSADTQIRIISGVDTVCKIKRASSLRTTLSPTSASFTPDGKHIVSTIEESGIHVWDYNDTKASSSSHKPKTIKSYEGFLSDNVSVAIPWLGNRLQQDSFCSLIADLDKKVAHFPPPVECFSAAKGATTWPEEKLGVVAGAAAAAISATASSRSKLRLLRSVCQNVKGSSPHLWGLVIVTATCDGRIRVFHNYGLPVRV